MYRDYNDLLCAFHAHGVRYLIVGGYAVIFHAQPRFTSNIDFFIKADLANAQATYAALASFGAPLEGIRPEEFADRGSFSSGVHALVSDSNGRCLQIFSFIAISSAFSCWKRRYSSISA